MFENISHKLLYNNMDDEMRFGLTVHSSAIFVHESCVTFVVKTQLLQRCECSEMQTHSEHGFAIIISYINQRTINNH